LIAHGADVNARVADGESKGMTALMLASSTGLRDSILTLLEHGADVNARMDSKGAYAGWTPLVFYLKECSEGRFMPHFLIRFRNFLSAGADPNVSFSATGFKIMGKKCGNDPRGWQAERGEKVVKCEIITKPLIVAAERGYYDLAKLLIEHGVDANSKITSGKWRGATALMAASKMGQVELAGLLIEQGSSCQGIITAEGELRGWTALSMALVAGQDEIAKRLIKCGADPEAIVPSGGFKGASALMMALIRNRSDVVKLLIDHGVDINAKAVEPEIKGMTALIIASGEGSLEMVKLLMAHEADVNAKITDGEMRGGSALVYAKLHGHQSVVDLLKTGGAKWDKAQERLLKKMKSVDN